MLSSLTAALALVGAASALPAKRDGAVQFGTHALPPVCLWKY